MNSKELRYILLPLAICTFLAVMGSAGTYTITTTAAQDNRLQQLVNVLARQASPSPAPYADIQALVDDVCSASVGQSVKIFEARIQEQYRQMCSTKNAAQVAAACNALGEGNNPNCGVCR